jgi:hypothetical protein
MHTPTNRNESAPFITVEMAQKRYNLSRGNVMKVAQDSGALIRFGRACRVNVEKCDAYFVSNFTVK